MRAAILCLLLPCLALACKCQLSMSACNEAASTDVIFIGTVEAIEPSFLDSWNASQRAALTALNEEYARVQNDHSPAAFTKLRDAYLKVFPDLPAEHRKRLAAATSTAALADIFYWILDHGKRVRLRVKTVFHGEELDDDETVQVWTAFGDCGIPFQIGETYLVYADSDEESDVMTTGACTRTRRLSDAGEDLAYLYYFKNFGDSAGRIEGFVTTDLLYQRELDLAHNPEHISSPVPGAVVELKATATPRYATADAQGRFVFDGLPAGPYTLSAFTPSFPTENHQLTAAREVRLAKRACALQILVAPQ
ncbi:MAG: hypothetical protein JWP63_397 [Candidatus Solibacter sp.]|nr:hypothetical protein [Candidatus Solibacter sp.]